MASDGIDVLVVTEPANIYYLTGYDAWYVAAAELASARLATLDRRLPGRPAASWCHEAGFSRRGVRFRPSQGGIAWPNVARRGRVRPPGGAPFEGILTFVLILLSPAKSLDYDSPIPNVKWSWPRLLNESVQLVDVMRTKSVAELARLSGISDELAALNAQRWADFSLPFEPENARPAILAFVGDVYRAIDVYGRFMPRDFVESQKVLRILSGLYGVLRPLDLMQPYRLEMGTRLETVRGKSLYDWWGTQITDQLRADLATSPGAPVVLNLASAEYFGAVQPEELGVRVISPRFEDTDANGKRSVVSFFAKHARGEMAYWVVRNRTYTPVVLPGFLGSGYRYDRAASTPDEPVFVRTFEDRANPSFILKKTRTKTEFVQNPPPVLIPRRRRPKADAEPLPVE